SQRHRYRSACPGADAVRRNDGLRPAVAKYVYEDSAPPRVLLYLKGSGSRMLFNEGLCDIGQRLPDLIKTPLRLDRTNDVDSLSAGRLHKSMIAIAFDMIFQLESERDDIREWIVLRRVEVKHNVVGFVEMRLPAMDLM